MSNRNYRKGSGYEYRRLEKVSQTKGFVKGERFYASKGVCDIWYVIKGEDGKLCYYEEQCKYGTKNYGKITTEEMIRLLEYAMDNEGKIKVALTTKMSRKPELIWWLN